MLKYIQGFFSENLFFRLLMFSLLLVTTACLVDFLYRPWPISWRVTRTLRRWKIKNALGEYPILKRVRKSPYKKHELVLELDGKGFGLVEMDKHLDHWKVGLNGAVRLDYGKKTLLFACIFFRVSM